MLSQTAIEVERMTITLENLSTRTAGLSVSPFRRIREDLHKAERLEELSLREVHAWWEDLQVDFIAYKQHLVRYLEDFIQDLQRSAAQIGAQLERFSAEQTARILDLVRRSELKIPRPQSEQTPGWENELLARCQGVWKSLLDWFVGNNSTTQQVLNVTNEVIRRAVQNAALLVQKAAA